MIELFLFKIKKFFNFIKLTFINIIKKYLEFIYFY